MITLSLEYNSFFRNDVIFVPWNHDTIASTCADEGI